MKQLVLSVLRLLLQLVLFVLTGRWHRLARSTPTLPHGSRTPPGKSRPLRTFSSDRKPTRGRLPPLTLDGEGALREPGPAVLEGGPRSAVRGRAVRTPARAAAPASVRAALADRRVLRDALAFDAALGARRRRR